MASSTVTTTEIAELLSVTAARLVRLQTRILERLEVPLTYRQERTLTRVRDGHTSIIALAKFANLTLPTVSECISVLVRRGLVSRQEDPNDRRLTLISLTPSGEKALEAARAALEQALGDLVSTLSAKSLTQFHDVLESVYENATNWVSNQDAKGS